jgi:voltage-gated potassium channel
MDRLTHEVVHDVSFQHFVYNCFEQEFPTRAGYITSLISLMFVLTNILVIILKTETSFPGWFMICLFTVELITTIELMAEIIIRLWSCTASIQLKTLPIYFRRNRYFFTFFNLLDFVTLTIQGLSISFWIMRWLTINTFDFMIYVQMIRLIRLFRIQRNFNGLTLIWKVTKKKWRELLMSAFLIIMFIIVYGAIMYSFEADRNPAFFGSIPKSLYYVVVTFATIGYGDCYPSYWGSRAFVTATVMIPVALFGIPVSILGAGVVEEIRLVSQKNAQRDRLVKQKILWKVGKKKDQKRQSQSIQPSPSPPSQPILNKL